MANRRDRGGTARSEPEVISELRPSKAAGGLA